MPTIKESLSQLTDLFELIQVYDREKKRLETKNRGDERFERRLRKFESDIEECLVEMEQVILDLDRFPERHHLRHSHKLKKFWEGGTFDESVFIMTKYPAEEEKRDQTKPGGQLQNVIDVVKQAISECGFKPRMASDQDAHRWIWDNVELYLLGCGRGVAIIEDKYLPELNPNVAMEWGWMTGMGRDVLFLREEGFQHERADWAGLMNYTFAWQDPAKGIKAALTKFLPTPKNAAKHAVP